MAAGKISIQANDGKVAGVVFEDGASSNVTVTVPKEGGIVVTDKDATITSNLNMVGTGLRITGEFSNATDSSRVAFESNVLNSYTVVSSFPNGTGALSSFRAFNTQSGLNSSFTEVYCDPAQSMVRAGRSGTGSYLPMTFNTNGAERMRIDTAGNVGIGTNNPASTLGKALHIYNSTNDGTSNSNASLKLESTSRNSAILLYGTTNTITMFNSAGVSAGGIAMDSNTGTTLIFGSNGFG